MFFNVVAKANVPQDPEAEIPFLRFGHWGEMNFKSVS
jgi:hypothetical protein